MPTIHLLIKGEVQGVFYRASAKEQALQLGVTGWVKNTAEGHVEIVATASDSKLQQFVKWCRKGPAKASVESIDMQTVDEQQFEEFTILRS